ncbi:MAG: CRISPR-associated helicase Cas3' [Thermomicrobiales bacterium]|nr:CRISPR-associated helicase Cas3' [Thermomicrobiales bacterium]
MTLTGDELRVWAKKSREKDDKTFHPLICHLIDVAQVAAVMWDEVITERGQEWFASQLGVSVHAARSWVVLLAGWHDIGKYCPGFQDRLLNADPHGTVSAAILRRTLREEPFGLDLSIATNLAVIAGGHHGRFPEPGSVNQARDNRRSQCRGKTCEGQRRFQEIILAISGMPGDKPARVPAPAVLWLAGFISVADWIGSNADYFLFVGEKDNVPGDFAIEEHRDRARSRARTALEELGWLTRTRRRMPRSFRELFPNIETPNDLQMTVERVAGEQSQPWMAIIEAPMGEGKTEAAFFIADDGEARLGLAGTYVALPTQATSNQMLTRRTKLLEQRGDGRSTNLQLLHGQSALSDEFIDLTDAYASFLSHLHIHDAEPEYWSRHDVSPTVLAASWFAGGKRQLLAEEGVGTIDQALLAVLQTRHVFVRLFGLAGKTVIIDEVHAYDTYMSTLLERLIEWLAALGCSVVLLSATLPSARRETLLNAFRLKQENTELPKLASYPSVSWVSGDTIDSVSITPSSLANKTVDLRWIVASDEWQAKLGAELAAALSPGSCAAVICNTVTQAQATYLALRNHFSREELILYHARFTSKARGDREKQVIDTFGKPSTPDDERPFANRRVVVATQVVEQSLDLDFDLMVTQMAPADLVLQRMGRLHRHQRTRRPAGLWSPQLWIVGPPEKDGLPDLTGSFGWVYDHHILLRSWMQLRNRSRIAMPGDIADMVEAVYGNDPGPLDDWPAALAPRLEETHRAQVAARDEEQSEATLRWIRSPWIRAHPADLCNGELVEDDPERHTRFQALTRLAEPSIQLVFLPLDNDGRALNPDDRSVFRRGDTPGLEQARALLKASVKVSGKRRVAPLLKELKVPAGWKSSPLLAHAYPVGYRPENGVAESSIYLKLDEELGVLFEDLQAGMKGGED